MTPPRVVAPEEQMLGPGGELRTPRSESAELSRILTMLTQAQRNLQARQWSEVQDVLAHAKSLAEKLRQQVASGYHRNPVYTPFRVVDTISRDVREVRYVHAKDGEWYTHDLRGDVNLIAIERHGKRELLLAHEYGKPLWDEF